MSSSLKLNPCRLFLSKVGDTSLRSCTLKQLQNIAEMVGVDSGLEKDTLVTNIREVCPLGQNALNFLSDDIEQTVKDYFEQYKGILQISDLLEGPLGAYTDYEYDSVPEMEFNTNLTCEDEEFEQDLYILDSASNMKKRIRSFVKFKNYEAPTKKVACIKLVPTEKKRAIATFFDSLTSTLVKKEIELDATIKSLKINEESLENNVESFKNK